MSPDADMELIGEYDEIEIPPVKPYVVRHRRFACRCAHCGAKIRAPAPAVATTTPFGPRIHALAIYLKSFQALSYERLRFLFRDAFGLIVICGRPPLASTFLTFQTIWSTAVICPAC